MLKEIIQHQYNVLLQSLIFVVLVGKNFFNAFVKMLEFCLWYGGFDKCVTLCLLLVQRNLHVHANSRQ
jgi:hypothetical protein